MKTTDAMLSGLPPIVGRRPRLLILGSMPSARSLAAGEYYAHPQNAFWPLMARLLELPPLETYAKKQAALKRGGAALWDALAACRREGSLDSAIVRESETANDIAALLAQHRTIEAVALNGDRARQCFLRHIKLENHCRLIFLPSTSPANARMNFSQKLAAWRAVAPFLRKF